MNDKVKDRADKALEYLVDTDELAASLKREATKAEQRWKSLRDTRFLADTQGTVADRTAQAANRNDVQSAYTDYIEACFEYDTVVNRRKTEAMCVDYCRSLMANRRQGNVT